MNNIAPSHAIKFARWQHPAVGRGAIFAVPAPCFIEVTFPINTLKQKSTIYDEQLPTHLENVDSQKIQRRYFKWTQASSVRSSDLTLKVHTARATTANYPTRQKNTTKLADMSTQTTTCKCSSTRRTNFLRRLTRSAHLPINIIRILAAQKQAFYAMGSGPTDQCQISCLLARLPRSTELHCSIQRRNSPPKHLRPFPVRARPICAV